MQEETPQTTEIRSQDRNRLDYIFREQLAEKDVRVVVRETPEELARRAIEESGFPIRIREFLRAQDTLPLYKRNIQNIVNFNLFGEIRQGAVKSSVYSLATGEEDNVTKTESIPEYTRFPSLREIQKLATTLIRETTDNIIGISPTGTGKTIAFLLGTVLKTLELKKSEQLSAEEEKKTKRLNRYRIAPRVVILAPTRSLRSQIVRDCQLLLSDLKISALTVRELSDDNIPELRAEIQNTGECDILVTKPSTLENILKQEKGVWISLSRLKFLICDEADSVISEEYYVHADTGEVIMIKDGKINPALAILNRARGARVFLFSATFRRTDLEYLRVYQGKFDFKVIQIENISQRFIQILQGDPNPKQACSELLRGISICRVLIFVHNNLEAEMLNLELKYLKSRVIRSDTVNTEEILDDYVNGRFNILITLPEVFGRGVHVDNIQLVINYGFESLISRSRSQKMDSYYERYKHQIGRTGRGLNTGISLTLLETSADKIESSREVCLAVLEEEGKSTDIEYISEEIDYGKSFFLTALELFRKLSGEPDLARLNMVLERGMLIKGARDRYNRAYLRVNQLQERVARAERKVAETPTLRNSEVLRDASIELKKMELEYAEAKYMLTRALRA